MEIVNKIINKVRPFARLPEYLLSKKNVQNQKINEVVYISETADWVIDWIWKWIHKNVSQKNTFKFKHEENPKFLSHRVLHFGSVHAFISQQDRIDFSTNKIIVTFFHGDFGISPEMDQTIHQLIGLKDRIDCIVVSCSQMQQRLVKWGIKEDKIKKIGLGTDLSHFKPLDDEERAELRAELGISRESLCIGSFQKDGEGWGEGNTPKMVKGPDLFVDAVKEISKTKPVHCLLAGPSRGYIKKRLDEESISYSHYYVKDQKEILKYYGALDFYLISSREEGGPLSLLESLATRTPLISTPVGMAIDLIESGQNAMMSSKIDSDELVKCVLQWLHYEDNERAQILEAGVKTVQPYDWKVLSQQYIELYQLFLH